MGRIDGQDLADDHPVEEHPQPSEPELHRVSGVELELRLHEGRDVDRLDLGKIDDAPTSHALSRNRVEWEGICNTEK
jgi:hypothetical protein